MENNLVYNTLSGGLMFNNGGHEHAIENNIFALSANHALWPYSEKRPSTFRRNIVYLTQGELLIPYGERSLNERWPPRSRPATGTTTSTGTSAGPIGSASIVARSPSGRSWGSIGTRRSPIRSSSTPPGTISA